MATGFAKEMEAEARGFIKELICEKELCGKLYGGDCNFKPWYSPRGLIDNAVRGVDRVLIGVNPGGCPRDPDHTTKDRLWEAPLDPGRPFNAYPDECWEGRRAGKSLLQQRVRKVFETLYGDQWELMLRSTACFNVCPIRTTKATDIPILAWERSVGWTKSVLNELKPSIIICNGNTKSGKTYRSMLKSRSPWAMLKMEYELERIRCKKLGDTNISLKFGESTVEPLKGTKVLALPHLTNARLTTGADDDLFRLLSERSDWLTGREKE